MRTGNHYEIGEIARRVGRAGLILVMASAVPFAAVAQPVAQNSDPLSVTGKLRFHAASTLSPFSILGTAAYAGILQADNAPTEWGQGAEAYVKRFASTMGWSGIHSTLAFGLDAALHEDPRYFRSHSSGFWRRSGHAVRGTFLTRTDAGGETISAWRIGSAYGAAILSNQWYPDRVNTLRLGMIQGSVTMGFDLLGNLGAEFWPDIKRKLRRK